MSRLRNNLVSHAESPPWNYYKSLFIIIIFIRNILRKLQRQSLSTNLIDCQKKHETILKQLNYYMVPTHHQAIAYWLQTLALSQKRLGTVALAMLMIVTDPHISVYSVNSANLFPAELIFSFELSDRIFSSFHRFITNPNLDSQSLIANFQIITGIIMPKKIPSNIFSG